jgi:hypothetical protein
VKREAVLLVVYYVLVAKVMPVKRKIVNIMVNVDPVGLGL